MKAVGDLQVLQGENQGLHLGLSFATDLGIREGMVLYGVALVPENPKKSTRFGDTEDRLMTLIMTPLPHASWPRLIRMSVTIDPRPGSLFTLIKALNSLRIFPRYIEDVTGTDLAHVEPYSPSRGVLKLDKSARRDDAILPSATLVLELPQIQDRPKSPEDDLYPLHSALSRVLSSPQASAEAILKLEEALAKEAGEYERKVTVQWISPMATLNKLHKLAVTVEKLRVSRSADGIKLQISLLPWRHELWPPSSTVPHSGPATVTSQPVLAMPSLDSDERIIACYFYQNTDRLVVQFEMTTPAFGLEHLWWEYIYGCVRDAKGTVLGSANTARINGRWGTLRCTAMFPLKDDPSHLQENVKPILDCFRKLQGDISETGRFGDFKKQLEKEHQRIAAEILPVEAQSNWTKKSRNFSSQLERLVVHDHSENTTAPRFSNEFAENPFSFTLPLGLETYNKLYGDPKTEEATRTRRRLAETIIEKLMNTPGENVAIVGAHRAGKTTVLRLVYDLLIERLKEDSGVPTLIPIKINASVTPPYLFFNTILEETSKLKEEISKLEQSSTQEEISKVEEISRGARRIVKLSQIQNNISTIIRALSKGTKINLGLAELDVEETTKALIELPQAETVAGDSRLRYLAATLKAEQRDILAEFLRASLQSLSSALKSGPSNNLRLVVIMDEFSESTAWGNDPRVLAVWRYAIESDEFSSIKWLFSTTRSIKEVSSYSPVTNIFFEVNVGSLRKEESAKMIDAFSVTGWKKELDGGTKLRPVITHPARRFLINVTSSLPYLLQVSCYHIYDGATRTSFPLINKALCRKTILGRVLPEMADYLEHQWHQIPESAQRFIRESLPKDIKSPDKFLEVFDQLWNVDLDRMPAGSLKALDRSGLRGEDGRCVAPLVAAWLLSREMQ
jgi:ABC-type transport system involved in cytochrome c biogenesis ATPase subunit